ncbi:MAG: TVP38/TMEM64 family protein [Nitrospirae bacterium]|nr:TVP38/TMEM64 family protein [Nitrospirota bacterium]
MAIGGGLAYVVYKAGLFQFFMDKERVLAFIDSLGPLGFIGFILLQVAQVIAAPVPGEASGLIGGFLYGPLLGTILSTIGLTIGSYIAFTLSRIFGRPFVQRIVDKSVIVRFDYLLEHKGSALIFILFLIPGVPKDYLCYILGLGQLSTMQFLVISSIGRLLGTMMLTIGGDYIRHERYVSLAVLVAVAAVVVFVAIAYKGRIERLFRIWHVREYKKRKARG